MSLPLEILKDQRKEFAQSLELAQEALRQREADCAAQAECVRICTEHVAEFDTAIAALEPAPAEQAPAQPDPLSAELRSVTPATEEEIGDQIEIPPGFTKWEGGECPVPHGTIVDLICRDPSVRVGQTNQVFAHMISWANEGDLAYNIIAYRIISQPADETPTDDLRTAEGETVAGDDRIDQQESVVQLAVDDYLSASAPVSTSVLDDPELIEAQKRLTARLEADTLAQVHSYWSEDIPERPVALQAEPTGYVGLQDKDLEADYDAMREREKADKPKLHFSIFGERGNRKLEDVE